MKIFSSHPVHSCDGDSLFRRCLGTTSAGAENETENAAGATIDRLGLFAMSGFAFAIAARGVCGHQKFRDHTGRSSMTLVRPQLLHTKIMCRRLLSVSCRSALAKRMSFPQSGHDGARGDLAGLGMACPLPVLSARFLIQIKMVLFSLVAPPQDSPALRQHDQLARVLRSAIVIGSPSGVQIVEPSQDLEQVPVLIEQFNSVR
jgi:hypothetical protein